MNEDKDTWTHLVNRVLDLLITKYPARTSIGVVLGLVFAFLAELFLPVLKTVELVDFAGAPKWGWIAVGILIAHVPTLFGIMTTKPISNEAIDELMALIDKGSFSRQEKRQQYRLLIRKVSENLALNQTTAKELRATRERLAESDEPEQ